MRSLCVTLLVVLGALCPTAGESALLGSRQIGGGGGTNVGDYHSIETVSFESGYVGRGVGGPCSFPMIGCTPIPIADVVPGAVFNWDASNDPRFVDVIAPLTNGNNDTFFHGVGLFSGAGAQLWGFGGGGGESSAFGGAPDFSGYHIDALRVVINSFELGYYCCPGNSGIGVTVDYTIEIYGSPSIDPAPLISLLSPHRDDLLQVGSTTKVSWTASDNQEVGGIDLSYSHDSGVTFQPVATGLPNSGSYDWTIPGPADDDALGRPRYVSWLRIETHDNLGQLGADLVGAFAITNPPTATLVTSFSGHAVDGGIEVRWQLTPGVAATGIALERGASEVGPWEVVRGEPSSIAGEMRVLDRDIASGLVYFYRLDARPTNGEAWVYGPIRIEAAAAGSGLISVGPNPSRGPVSIGFALARDAAVRLTIVDLQGRELAVVNDAWLPAGRHDVVWNGMTELGLAPPGVFFVRMRSDGQTFQRRLALTR